MNQRLSRNISARINSYPTLNTDFGQLITGGSNGSLLAVRDCGTASFAVSIFGVMTENAVFLPAHIIPFE
jgi:hypothetical protein